LQAEYAFSPLLRFEVPVKHKKPFSLELTDRVLVVTAHGVWTLADAKTYVRQFRLLMAPVIEHEWAIILDARRWQLCPADVFAVLKDNTLWCFQRKLTYVVTLLPEDNLLRWQFAKATEIDKPDALHSHLADDEQAAFAMVRAAGYMN
jgi:hypothetical protein